MIPKVYSESVSLEKQGARLTSEFRSTCRYNNEKSYRSSALLIPKMVARHFVTVLTVDDEHITYYESVEFERKVVISKYSETVNQFPKEKAKECYRTSVRFEPNWIHRHYVTGIELFPVQRLAVAADSEAEQKLMTSGLNITNGEIYGEELHNGLM